MAHLAKRLGLDLPDAIAGDTKLLADLLLHAAVVYPESKLGDALKFYSVETLAKNPARLSYPTIQTGGTNQLAAPMR